MAKKKDHLWNPVALAKSVLLGTDARSLCGIVKKFDREALEDTEYYGTCAKCVAVSAQKHPAEDTITTLKKRGWAATLEAAFVALATQPTWVGTFTSSSGGSVRRNPPPAA